jgi:putative ABC transport system permease protein
VLSSLGATLGLGLGVLAIATLRQLYPTFPAAAPGWAYAGAIGVALGTGLIFGWLPAKRAAAVDPVIALARR